MKASELIEQLQNAMRETETDPQVTMVELDPVNPRYGTGRVIKEVQTTSGGEFWLIPFTLD